MLKNSKNFFCFDFIKKFENNFLEKFVCFVCLVLGVLNLGFWVSDSIGEGWFFVFIILMYRVYELGVWFFIIKIILFFIIFY